MKFELKPLHRNTPLKVLLDDLRNTAKRLGKKKLTVTEYTEKGSYHAATIIRRLGSWNNVLKKAGLQLSKPHNIPTGQLFDNLKKLWIRLGRQPTYNDMCFPQSKYSKKTYTNRFGTWYNALEQFVAYANSTGQVIETASNEKITVRRRNTPKHKTSRIPNWRLRFLTMKRDNFRCAACGTSPANDPGVILHVDHILPWDKGGETISENLQTLCSVCNIGKSNTGDSLLK